MSTKGKRFRKPSAILAAMRAVSEQAKEQDKGNLQAICRQSLEESADRFIVRLAALEKDHWSGNDSAAKTPSAAKVVEEPIDKGTERAAALLAEEWADVQQYFRTKGPEAQSPVPGLGALPGEPVEEEPSSIT